MTLPAGLPGTVSKCGLCDSWDLRQILDMGSQPLAEAYGSTERFPLELLECRACTLIQLSYIVPPRKVFPAGHSYASGNTRALRDHFRDLACLLGTHLAPGDLAIDIGANDGTLLQALRPYAPQARRLGVEPTGQAKKCERRGIPAWQDFFTAAIARDIRKTHGPAKVITACNVLAHVPDPHDFTAGVVRLLADDGVFVTENHDAASVLDGLQVNTVYHEHARFWSVTTLSRLLGDHGLVVTDVEKIPVHGGSFRAAARRQKTRDLSWRATAAARALRELLAAADGPVYGIGATTRATPLIHYAGIAEYLTCVCEVPGSEKIGQNIPGTAIPVVDEAKLIADQPPHALLLSWHIADSIIPALRAKGYGGKFIVPLPEARVTDG